MADWLQLHLVASARHIDAIEDALFTLGAVSVTLGERGTQPVLEPGVGETPLWPEIALSALFPRDSDCTAVLAALAAQPGISAPRWEELHERAWEREWLQHFRPLRCGARLWIVPHETAFDEPGAVVLRLDPGLAFGTGTHPSTALCLEWLDANEPSGQRVIDYGCGSGILGIAALLLGASAVHAVDIDPQALLATRENAARNAIADGKIDVGLPDALPAAKVELLLANILAGPLCELAPRFAALTRPGARAVLAGVLGREQMEAVCAAHARWFDRASLASREDWWRIELLRNESAA